MHADAASRPSARVPAPVVIALIATCALAAFLIRGVEMRLGEAHAPGRAGGGVGTIASPSLLWNPQPARDLTESWRDFGQSTVQELTNRYLWLDLIFMSTLSALLLTAIFAVSARLRIRHRGTRAMQAVLARSTIVLGAYLFADVGETYLATRHWSGIHNEGSLALERTIGAFSLAKWVLYGTVLAVLLVSFICSFRQRPRRLPVTGEQ
jgi:hypothetical protein